MLKSDSQNRRASGLFEVESPVPRDWTYSSDAEPGIHRKRSGKSFLYVLPSGREIRRKDVLQRINKLAIPPAWTNVWISRDPNSHLQATGRDKRGRKQYLYHPEWREERELTKFSELVSFAKCLPRLRRHIRRNLGENGLGRQKVLSTVVSLLDTLYVRVGNEEYAESNHSYGLTTLKDGHAKISRGKVEFCFQGKSGKSHRLFLEDPKIAAIVKKCKNLPGDELFEYLDNKGRVHDVTSRDVNDFLRTTSCGDITAKDFRTWHGTVAAFSRLSRVPPAKTLREAKRHVSAAVKAVSELLGNTPAVCRKSYVHPAVLTAFSENRLGDLGEAPQVRGLNREEARTLHFLKTGMQK